MLVIYHTVYAIGQHRYDDGASQRIALHGIPVALATDSRPGVHPDEFLITRERLRAVGTIDGRRAANHLGTPRRCLMLNPAWHMMLSYDGILRQWRWRRPLRRGVGISGGVGTCMIPNTSHPMITVSPTYGRSAKISICATPRYMTMLRAA